MELEADLLPWGSVMPCEVCGHTVHSLNGGVSKGVILFWCPRCGSLKIPDGVPTTEPPALVGRVRKLLEATTPEDFENAVVAVMESVGVKAKQLGTFLTTDTKQPYYPEQLANPVTVLAKIGERAMNLEECDE